MRIDSHPATLPDQALGSSKNPKGQQNGLGAKSSGEPPASQVSDASNGVRPVNPAPLLSSGTIVAISETTSDLQGEVQTSTAAPDPVPASTAPGRSGETPSAKAREAIAQNPELENLPFGRVVSLIARGLPVEDLVQVPEGETVEVDATETPVEVIETGSEVGNSDGESVEFPTISSTDTGDTAGDTAESDLVDALVS